MKFSAGNLIHRIPGPHGAWEEHRTGLVLGLADYAMIPQPGRMNATDIYYVMLNNEVLEYWTAHFVDQFYELLV